MVLVSLAGLCQGQPLANSRLSGLYVNSIEQVLALEPDQIDLATAVLIISEQWSDNVQGKKYVEQMDEMAREILDQMEKKHIKKNYDALPLINEYLFEELKFRPVDTADNPDDLFLHSVIDNRLGYCLSLSVLYLGIGERIGLPLYGVVVPGHFFVRYDDGKVKINIEATSKGGYADDNHYIEKFKIPSSSNKIYMTNLDKRQTLGCFFNNLGNSYRDVGEMDSALRSLEKAVEINPGLAESRANLANIYLDKNMVEQAIEQYKIALLANQNDAKTHNNLGNAYAKKDWLSQAVAEYKTAIVIDPNFVDSYKNLAIAYSRKKMYRQAIAQIDKALTLPTPQGDLYLRLGNIQSQAEQFHDAIKAYKKALDTDPTANAYFAIGICYGKINERDNEIKAYKSAIKMKPDMVEAIGSLGNAYFALKQYDKAIEQYKKAVSVEPKNKDLRYNLAAAYSNTDQFRQAADQYMAALEIDPQIDRVHSGLAFVFYKLNDFEAAYDHAAKAQLAGQELPKGLMDAIKEKLK